MTYVRSLLIALMAASSSLAVSLPAGNARAQEPPPAASAPSVVSGYPTGAQGYPSATNPYGVKISTQQATRLRALEADLNVLAARSEGRVLNGSLSVGMGVAFITLGVFVNDAWLRTLLMLTGGVATSRGVVELTVLPDAEKPALEFTHLPMLSSAQVMARLTYGEQALAEIARRTRIARLLDGSLTMLAGAGYVPIYAFARNREDKSFRYGDDASDYIIAVFSGLTFVTGLVTVIMKSPAERRLLAYGKLRERLAAEERGPSASRSQRWPDIAPYANRDGAGLAAHMRF